VELGHSVVVVPFSKIGHPDDYHERFSGIRRLCNDFVPDLMFTGSFIGVKGTENSAWSQIADCPIVNFQLGAWAAELQSLFEGEKNNLVERFNTLCVQTQLLYWFVDRESYQHAINLGFKHCFFEPWPLILRQFFPKEPNYYEALHTIDRSSPNIIRKRTLMKFPRGKIPDWQARYDTGFLLYLGMPTLETIGWRPLVDPEPRSEEGGSLFRLGQRLGERRARTPRCTLLEATVPNDVQEGSNTTFLDEFESYLAVFYESARAYVTATRVPLMQLLADTLGDELLLFGTPWREQGIESLETHTNLRLFLYHDVPYSLDLGSSSFSTSWYQRAVEVVTVGGCLFKIERYDDEEMGFVDGETCVTFGSPEEMLEKLSFYKDKPDLRQSMAKRAHLQACRRFNAHEVLVRVIKRATA